MWRPFDIEVDELNPGDEVRRHGSESVGWVIRSNGERALVRETACAESGADEWRGWVKCERLEVKA